MSEPGDEQPRGPLASGDAGPVSVPTPSVPTPAIAVDTPSRSVAPRPFATISHSTGPYPPPEFLVHYEHVAPGFLERAEARVDRAESHARALELRGADLVEKEAKREFLLKILGLSLAALLSGSLVVLAFVLQGWPGAAVLGAPLLTVGAVFGLRRLPVSQSKKPDL